MKRIFKTRPFIRWMRKTDLTDKMLYQAISEINRGLFEGNLGGNLIKKRIALPDAANGAVFALSLQRIIVIYGFSCLATRRMNVPISTKMK